MSLKYNKSEIKEWIMNEKLKPYKEVGEMALYIIKNRVAYADMFNKIECCDDSIMFEHHSNSNSLLFWMVASESKSIKYLFKKLLPIADLEVQNDVGHNLLSKCLRKGNCFYFYTLLAYIKNMNIPFSKWGGSTYLADIVIDDETGEIKNNTIRNNIEDLMVWNYKKVVECLLLVNEISFHDVRFYLNTLVKNGGSIEPLFGLCRESHVGNKTITDFPNNLLKIIFILNRENTKKLGMSSGSKNITNDNMSGLYNIMKMELERQLLLNDFVEKPFQVKNNFKV